MAKEKKEKRGEILSRHLREVKAKRKSKSFNSLTKRLRLEQEFRNTLAFLKENGIAFQEILPSLVSDKKAEFTPDFMMWKHDVKVPIFLIEYDEEEGEYNISRDELADYLSLLKKTDHDIVMAVWMLSLSFPCRVFKMADIEKRLESEDERFVISDVSPFKQRVLDYFDEKILVLPVVKFKKIPKLRKPERLLRSFESTLRETIRTEVKSRRPRLTHRKEAIADISDKDLNKICSLIGKYFMGELGAKDVVRLLKEHVETRHSI